MKEVKSTPFTVDTIICIGEPKGSSKRLSKLINTFKIYKKQNLHTKSVKFLCISNDLTEKELV